MAIRKLNLTRASTDQRAPDSFEAWARTLEASGLSFSPEDKRWHLIHSASAQPQRPLQLQSMSVLFRRSRIEVEEIVFQLDTTRWARSAQNAAKECWGTKTRAELHVEQTNGKKAKVWIVIEFTRPEKTVYAVGSARIFEPAHFPTGILVAGMDLRPGPSSLLFQTSHLCAAGYVPGNIWDRFGFFLRRSLQLPGTRKIHAALRLDNFLSQQIATAELTGSPDLQACQTLQEALKATGQNSECIVEDANSIETKSMSGTIVWRIKPSISSVLPETDQDLIRAQEQAAAAIIDSASRQTLAKGLPSALRKWTDDPLFCLLADSAELISAREGDDPKRTFTAISRLILRLYESWPQVEISPAATTVVSEMAGDAWAGLHSVEGSFERAKVAWGKAAATRAHPLRILKKIAASARSRSLLEEEAAALTAILKQEKRRDELATAMVRLAALKEQKSDHISPNVTESAGGLLERAATISPRDPEVLQALFRHLRDQGALSRAFNIGRELRDIYRENRDTTKLADISCALAQIELAGGSLQMAHKYFAESLAVMPHSIEAILGLATVAARLEEPAAHAVELEKALRLLLESENPTHQSRQRLQEATALFLKLPASQIRSRQQTLLKLIDSATKNDHLTMTIQFFPEWMQFVETLTNNNYSQEIKTGCAKLILAALNQTNGEIHGADKLPFLGMHLLQLSDIESVVLAMSFLSIVTRRIQQNTANNRLSITFKHEGQPDLKICAVLRKIVREPEKYPDGLEWLKNNLPALVKILDPFESVPLMNEILVRLSAKATTASAESWPVEAAKIAIAAWSKESVIESPSAQQKSALHFKLGLELFRYLGNHGTIADVSTITKWMLSQIPGIGPLFVRAIDPATAGPGMINIRNMSDTKLLATIMPMSDDPVWLDTLSARIFSLVQTDILDTDTTITSALQHAISEAASRRTLSKREIDFIVIRAAKHMDKRLFESLLEQATFIEDETTAANLFSICLDHTLMKERDESAAGEVIEIWLNRLRRSAGGSKGAQSRREATLGQLAAELLRLQSDLQFEQKANSSTSLREKLARAGLVPPENPSQELLQAISQNEPERTDRLCKALIDQGTPFLAETIKAALNTLKQQKKPIISPSVAIDRLMTIPTVALALGENPQNGDSLKKVGPDGIGHTGTRDFSLTLSLLCAEFLNDAGKKVEILKTTAERYPDEKRLWIPLYLALAEMNDHPSTIRHLEAIIPHLQENQDILIDYPFTIESLESELKRLRGSVEINQLLDLDDLSPPDGLPSPAEPLKIFDEEISHDSGTVPALGILTSSPQPDELPAQVFTQHETTNDFEALKTDELSFSMGLEPEIKNDKLMLANPVLDHQPEPLAESKTELPHAYVADASDPTPIDPPEIAAMDDTLMPTASAAPSVIALEPGPKFVQSDSQAPEPVAFAIHAPIQPPPIVPVPDGLDWKTAVRERKLPPGILQRMLDKPFADKIEKHLALQAIAVMRGEVYLLDKWDWRVWRKAHEYGYSRSGKSRFPQGLSPRVMKTQEFKLLLRAGSPLARAFPDRFTIDGLAKTVRLKPAQVMAKRQRLDWSTGLAGYAGFSHHANAFKATGLEVYSIQGLGPQIFYEMKQQVIYVDDAYFARKPPSHFYHRIMFVLYALKMQFYFLLNLNVEQHIYTELEKFRVIVTKGGLQALAAKIKLTDSKLARAMTPADYDEIKLMIERTSTISVDEISDSLKAMQQYIWRLMLADSVNLVGILEAMLDIDLALPGSVKENEVLLMSPQVDPLLNFALAMNLRDQPNS